MTGATQRRLAGAGPADYICALQASELFVDDTYQRDLDRGRAAKIARRYDARLLGILEVSARDDDRFAIIDGQHRWYVAQEVDAAGTDVLLVCHVHLGLSVEDEARLFNDFGTQRKALNAWDRWKARRRAGEPAVLDIEVIVAKNGFHAAAGSRKDYSLQCVAMLERVVKKASIDRLDECLSVLAGAWDGDPDSTKAILVGGVADVLSVYGADLLDRESFGASLRASSPLQLIARASEVGRARGPDWAQGMAVVLVQQHNRRVDTKAKVPQYVDQLKRQQSKRG